MPKDATAWPGFEPGTSSMEVRSLNHLAMTAPLPSSQTIYQKSFIHINYHDIRFVSPAKVNFITIKCRDLPTFSLLFVHSRTVDWCQTSIIRNRQWSLSAAEHVAAGGIVATGSSRTDSRNTCRSLGRPLWAGQWEPWQMSPGAPSYASKSKIAIN